MRLFYIVIDFFAVICYNIHMKTRECVKNPEDSPMYRLGRHWNTIQAYLIPGIEDDIGELGEDLKRFTQTCELLITTSSRQKPSGTEGALAWSACSGCSRTPTAAAWSGCAGTRRCSCTSSQNQNLHALHVLHGYQKRFCNYL